LRPVSLNPLFAPLTSLAGIGPKQEKLYARLLGRGDEPPRLLDLLLHLPSGNIDRRNRPKLRDVVEGEVATVAVTIDAHHSPPRHRPRAPYRIQAHDETGDIILIFFNPQRGYLEKLLPEGELRYVSGAVEIYDGMRQMVHPDRIVAEKDLATLASIEPVYPLTEGLSLRQVSRAVDLALAKAPPLPEWQDSALLARHAWPSFAQALGAVHRPSAIEDAKPEGQAWSRLAFDELLAGQLALALLRAQVRRPVGRRNAGDGRLRQRIVDALPFALTASQRQAADEIAADLAAPQRMLRLLQGDVGSGKTVVALLAAAAVAETGRQAALMAPTELLARQHFGTIAPLAQSAGLTVALLTGR
jgi:ATP-dependent DNA helicase RecG